jgi:hypothetical protein
MTERKAPTTADYFPLFRTEQPAPTPHFPTVTRSAAVDSIVKGALDHAERQNNNGFLPGSPMVQGNKPSSSTLRKGEKIVGNEASAHRQRARDTGATGVGDHGQYVKDFIPVTQIQGWTAGAAEVVASAGIAMPIRDGMLCIAIVDIPRATAALDRTFGRRA